MKALLLAAALLLCTAAAPTPLIVGGEQIADGATYAAAKGEGTLLLYSTYNPTSMEALLAHFKADTGLNAEVVRLPTEVAFNRIESEFAAHKLPADYVDLTDVTLVQQLAQRGILRPYRSPSDAKIESTLRDAEGRWYTVIRGITAIGVNTGVVKQADVPATWRDLLDPKWKGKIEFSDIDAGGTGYGLFYFLRQRFGDDYWKRLAQQQPRIVVSSAPVGQDLARGNAAAAFDGLSTLVALTKTGTPLAIVVPQAGVPAFGIIGGITSTAPHPHAAQVWMNWLTSRRGCAAIAEAPSYGARRDDPVPEIAGVRMPPERSLYNLRPADYGPTRLTLTKEWYALFGDR